MKSLRSTGLAALIFLGAAAPSFAETTVSMQAYRTVEKSELVDGAEKVIQVLVPVESAVPGDMITYKIDVKNQDEEPASDISLALPIDSNTTFVEGSVSGSVPVEVKFSVDEGLTFGDLSQLAVMDENGNLRAATTADLTDMTLRMPRLDALSAAEIDYSVTVD